MLRTWLEGTQLIPCLSMTTQLLKTTQQSLSVKRVISIKSKFFFIDLQGQRHGKPDYSLGKVSVWVLIVRDKKSVSGTFVNMKRVTTKTRLHHNDTLQFGKCGLKFKFVCSEDRNVEKDHDLREHNQSIYRSSFEGTLEPALNLIQDR